MMTCRKLRYFMRYIPPGVTDIQLYGVSKATVHDPDPGYYRYRVAQFFLFCRAQFPMYEHMSLQPMSSKTFNSMSALLQVLPAWCMPALRCIGLHGNCTIRLCSCAARDIVLQHMWDGRTPAKEPLQVEHSFEQPRADDTEPSESSKTGTGVQMQAILFSNCARLTAHL